MDIIVATKQKHFFETCYIRSKVFVEEQQVSIDEEIDAVDATCTHVLAYIDNQAAGCCRLILEEKYLKVGRLAVLKPFRHQKVASSLLQFAETFAQKRKFNVIKLDAQIQAKQLYLNNGYQEVGEIFLDANIEHIMMVKKL